MGLGLVKLNLSIQGDFHADPADGLIVASARVFKAALLTFDKEIIKFVQKGYSNIIKPKKNKRKG